MGSRPIAIAAVAVALASGAVATAWAANDPGASRQWGMQLIGAEAAWATGTAQGMTIAIVDTGVDADHEDLRGRVLPGRNYVTAGAPASDDNGHGTHVAGIAAAAVDNHIGVIGVAPNARILPVKVLGADGTGDITDVPAGITWAANQGAQVINLSLGVEAVGIPGERISATGAALRNAVEDAWRKGSIVVVAAGNDDSAKTVFANQHAVVVTATDAGDNKASYATEVGMANWGIAAPGGSGATQESRAGENILSTYWVAGAHDKYAYAAGTSMAAPHVAGALAILRERGLDKQQAVDRVLATAKDLGDPGHDDVYGAGRLDVAKAVAGLPPASRTSGSGGTGSTTTTGHGGGRTATTTTTSPTTTQPVGVVGTGNGGQALDIEPFDGNGPAPGRPGLVGGAGGSGTHKPGRGGPPWAQALAGAVLLGAATAGIVRARRA